MKRSIVAICFVLSAALWLAPACASAAEFMLGVGTHLGQGVGQSGPTMNAIVDAGFNSLRDEFLWSHIEKRRGELNIPPEFRALDQTVQTARSKGVEPLLILGYGNSLYAPGFPLAPEARAAFLRYVNFIVTRYKGKVRYYELWNEWNQGMGGGDDKAGRAPAQYASLLRDVYAAVKTADPSALLLGGAVEGSGNTDWIEDLLATGAAKFMDGLSVHPYVFHKGAAGTPERLFSWMSALVERMQRQPDAAALPIYVTEIGWPADRNGKDIDDARAADYLSRVLLSLRSIPQVRGIWWYNLQDAKQGGGHFGLLDSDASPKPAYLAAQDVVALVRDARSVERVRADAQAWVLRINTASGETVYALWSPGRNSQGIALDFTEPGASISMHASSVAKRGDAIPIGAISAHSAVLKLDLGPTPLLLRPDAKTQLDNAVISKP